MLYLESVWKLEFWYKFLSIGSCLSMASVEPYPKFFNFPSFTLINCSFITRSTVSHQLNTFRYIEGAMEPGWVFSNPRGSEKLENRHRMKNGKDEMKELRFSSYLVQTAPKIVHRISWNQLMKIKGESTSKAPTSQSSNEMVKWEVKTLLNYFYVLRVKYYCPNSFSKHILFISN